MKLLLINNYDERRYCVATVMTSMISLLLLFVCLLDCRYICYVPIAHCPTFCWIAVTLHLPRYYCCCTLRCIHALVDLRCWFVGFTLLVDCPHIAPHTVQHLCYSPAPWLIPAYQNTTPVHLRRYLTLLPPPPAYWPHWWALNDILPLLTCNPITITERPSTAF